MYLFASPFILFSNLFFLVNARQFRVTDQVYLDLIRDDKPLGRLVIGLFGDLAPKAVKNFKILATEGINGQSYKGTSFNRIIKRFMVQGAGGSRSVSVTMYNNKGQAVAIKEWYQYQSRLSPTFQGTVFESDDKWQLNIRTSHAGGDVVSDDGSGSISIYGETFDDENLDTQHTGAGFVSMANKGPNTNGCQFLITTTGTPWLDNLHTVIGKVVEGQNIVHMVEHTPTDAEDRPTRRVYVADCGLLPTPQPYYISDDPYDLWAWIRASAVPLTMSFSILGFFHWMMRKMEIQ